MLLIFIKIVRQLSWPVGLYYVKTFCFKKGV